MLDNVHLLVYTYNIFTTGLSSLSEYSSLVKVDISFNKIDFISDAALESLVHLVYLDAAGNQLTEIPSLHETYSLIFLNVSFNLINLLSRDLLKLNHNLKFLDLFHNKIQHLQLETFGSIQNMSMLALKGNDIISFDPKLLNHFSIVNTLISDKYQHCCLVEMVGTCSTISDGLSTCDVLLANPAIKVTVYIVCVVGITGNSYVIFSRIKYKQVHSELIINLAISDAAYSVYLLAISVADVYYAGAYILFDELWRNSFLCKIMSFLSVFSSQLSIAVLTCISIERYVIVLNTTRMKLHTGVSLPRLMIPVVWTLTFITSLLPLLLNWIYEETYSAANTICVFLEMTNKRLHKRIYHLCVFFVINGLCFLVTLVIYVKIVHLNQQSAKRVGRKLNLSLVKRSFLVVFTNFLCWTPITGFILFSYSGMTLPSSVTVWMAILVLPINSAANTVIYTLSTMCRK